MAKALPPRSRLASRLRVKLQFLGTRDQLNGRAGVVQKASHIKRRSTGSEHNNIFSLEGCNFVMPGAVRKELRGQMGQILWDIFEVSNSDSEHNASCLASLSGIQLQGETACCALDADHHFVFELGHHPVLEGETVGCECIQAHGKPHVGVGNATLRTKLLQSEGAIRIVDVRCEAVRLQAHTFGHVRDPRVHRWTEDPERQPALSQVSGYRKTVGASANDYNVLHDQKGSCLCAVQEVNERDE